MIFEGKMLRLCFQRVFLRIFELVRDKDEWVVLKVIEVINIFFELGDLSEEDYERVMEIFQDVFKLGVLIFGEYVVEGFGKLGVNVVVIVYKLINWLFFFIGLSKKCDVQSVVIMVLIEIVSKIIDLNILNRVFDGIIDFFFYFDLYVVERVFYLIDRFLIREKEFFMRNKLKVVSKIKEFCGDVKFGFFVFQVMEKFEKVINIVEEIIESEGVIKVFEVFQYLIDDVEKLFDVGKVDIVVEMVKLDLVVMEKVFLMLESEDYMRRMDVFWIVLKLIFYFIFMDVYRILLIFGEFFKLKNVWVREIVVKILVDIYVLYLGIFKFFVFFLDVFLKLGNLRDIEGVFEFMVRLLEKIFSEDMCEKIIKLIFCFLDDEKVRGVVFKFLVREVQKFFEFDMEVLFIIKDKFKEFYGLEGGKYDEIIVGLIDVIDDIFKMRRQGIVVNVQFLIFCFGNFFKFVVLIYIGDIYGEW